MKETPLEVAKVAYQAVSAELLPGTVGDNER